MTTDLTLPIAPKLDAGALEQVLIKGDLSKLSEIDRMAYYRSVCESLGLNPLTQPFAYLNLSGKMTLYAKRDATEQLRKIHGVSITTLEKLFHEGLYIVTAYAQDKTGRTDASTGAVSIATLKGENLANALMKAETKAKRRVTLSICGLGLLDETEVADVPKAVTVEAQTQVIEGATVNTLTGEEVPQDGALRILSVTKQPSKSGRGCWLLKLSDGREAYTFKEQESGLAEACAQVSESVIVETKESTRGLDVVSIRRVTELEGEKAPAPPTEVTADQIPF